MDRTFAIFMMAYCVQKLDQRFNFAWYNWKQLQLSFKYLLILEL